MRCQEGGGRPTQGPQSLRPLVSSLNEKEVLDLVVAMTSSSSSMTFSTGHGTFCFHSTAPYRHR
jgi:hypothetical protein